MSTLVLKTLNYFHAAQPSSLAAVPPAPSVLPAMYELEVGACKGEFLKPCTNQLGYCHAWPGGQMPNIPTPALPSLRPPVCASRVMLAWD